MRYTGTLTAVKEVEKAIRETKNFTVIRDSPNGDIPWHTAPSATSAIYEVYLSSEAAPFTQDSDKWFYLVGYQHVIVRMAFFERDNTARVDISPRKLPNLLVTYPAIGEALAKLEYKDNPRMVYQKA